RMKPRPSPRTKPRGCSPVADVWTEWAERRAPAAFAAEPAALPDPASIAPREWLYGTALVRRFVSVLIAPGGVGKSALALAQALALATGEPFLGERVHHSVPVWVLNLEDPLEELNRRLAALMIHHAIPPARVAGRLFLHSGRSRRVTMAAVGPDGGTIIHPDKSALTDAVRERSIGSSSRIAWRRTPTRTWTPPRPPGRNSRRRPGRRCCWCITSARAPPRTSTRRAAARR